MTTKQLLLFRADNAVFEDAVIVNQMNESIHKCGGHDLTNLRVNWEVERDWKIFARINNLFDK